MWGTEDQELVTVADAPTPNPNLADRIDMTRIITAGDGHRSIVFQSSVSDSDRRAAAARLRKLDRIEAANGRDIEWSIALAVCRELAVRYPSWASDLSITETLLRRLANALEVPDAD